MLADKRARLVEQLAEIQDSIDFIDAKQRFYDNVLSGATPPPYVSVLMASSSDRCNTWPTAGRIR